MIPALIAICSSAIAFWAGYHLGRNEGMRRAAFEDAWRKAQGK